MAMVSRISWPEGIGCFDSKLPIARGALTRKDLAKCRHAQPVYCSKFLGFSSPTHRIPARIKLRHSEQFVAARSRKARPEPRRTVGEWIFFSALARSLALTFVAQAGPLVRPPSEDGNCHCDRGKCKSFGTRPNALNDEEPCGMLLYPQLHRGRRGGESAYSQDKKRKRRVPRALITRW
jgi:hypothetical protein